MQPNNPSAIALKRFLETVLIVMGSALLVVMPLIVTALQPCSTLPSPATPQPASCSVPWNTVLNAFIVAVLSGAINSLTAFISAVHQNTQMPQLFNVTPQMPQTNGELAVATPVAATPAVPVEVVNPPTAPVEPEPPKGT